MTPERLFELSNAAVFPFWLLMMAAPRWRGTRWIVKTKAGVLLMGLLYAGLVIPVLPDALSLVAAPKLETLLPALATPAGFTTLWIHVLVFDLFVGTWVFEECDRRQDPSLIRIPLLFLCLMFGPLGFLADRLWNAWRSKTKFAASH